MNYFDLRATVSSTLKKFPNGKDYVGVKNFWNIFHPHKNNVLREKNEPNVLRTQHQVV